MCPRNIFLGYIFDQHLLHLERCVLTLRYESQAVADTKHVRIDSHRGTTESNALHHVCRLATDTRQVQ